MPTYIEGTACGSQPHNWKALNGTGATDILIHSSTGERKSVFPGRAPRRAKRAAEGGAGVASLSRGVPLFSGAPSARERRGARAPPVQTREHEDDELVEALHMYTKKLQTSLHIVNDVSN